MCFLGGIERCRERVDPDLNKAVRGTDQECGEAKRVVSRLPRRDPGGRDGDKGSHQVTEKRHAKHEFHAELVTEWCSD